MMQSMKDYPEDKLAKDFLHVVSDGWFVDHPRVSIFFNFLFNQGGCL